MAIEIVNTIADSVGQQVLVDPLDVPENRFLRIQAFAVNSEGSTVARFYLQSRNDNGDDTTVFGDPDVGVVINSFGPVNFVGNAPQGIVDLPPGEGLILNTTFVTAVTGRYSLQLIYEVVNFGP